MINYLLQILADFIRRRVFREEERIDLPGESDEPTKSLDCSCNSPFSNEHPPDLKRLLEIFKLVRETLDLLFPILEPIHAFQAVSQLGVRMACMMEMAIEDFASAKFYTEKTIQDLEKLVRHEPVEPGFLETTRRDRTYGLTRRIELLCDDDSD